jgi:hypothetical protein
MIIRLNINCFSLHSQFFQPSCSTYTQRLYRRWNNVRIRITTSYHMMRALVTHTMLVPLWVRELKMGFGLYALSSFPPPFRSQIEKRMGSASTVNPAAFCSKSSDRSFNLLWYLLARLRVNFGDTIHSRCSSSCLPLPRASFETLTVRSQNFHPPLDFISDFGLEIFISSLQLELQRTTLRRRLLFQIQLT